MLLAGVCRMLFVQLKRKRGTLGQPPAMVEDMVDEKDEEEEQQAVLQKAADPYTSLKTQYDTLVRVGLTKTP
jgi:hypothetical protein